MRFYKTMQIKVGKEIKTRTLKKELTKETIGGIDYASKLFPNS